MSAALHAGLLVVLGALAMRAAWSLLERAGDVAARRLVAPARVADALVDAAVPWSADDVWTGWIGGLVVATAIALLEGGIGLTVVVDAVLVIVPVGGLAARRGRSGRLVDAALPELLDAVTRSLRSGATLPQALREAGERASGRLRADVLGLVDEVEGGRSLVTAVEAWGQRCVTPGVRLVVAALAVSVDSGGAAARSLDGVAATLRANLAVIGELRAQSSQARLSALVIGVAPLLFAVLAVLSGGTTAEFLLRSPLGLACLTVGLAIDGAGAWWMQRITAVVP